MAEPWYDPNAWAWLPGTALGVAAGLWGSLVGTLAPRGKAKALVLGSYAALLLTAVGVAIAGGIAGGVGQPFAVWFFLLLPGIITAVALIPLGRLMDMTYRRAEEQRMRAQEFQ